jgi:hypothetical protein
MLHRVYHVVFILYGSASVSGIFSRIKMRILPFLILFLFCCFHSLAQFPGAAGQPGSTAIAHDSACFIAWANRAIVQRGSVNCADSNSISASFGEDSFCIGPADNFVVSLGDGGTAIMFFEIPISDGPGADFAIFENAFGDQFLELAFVEVSSDGKNFYRFPAISLLQDTVQIGPYDYKGQPELLHNLAGKYRAMFGTPFDLAELKDIPGLDIQNIIAVKVIDVKGAVRVPCGSLDSRGHFINDPWPTPFANGGFDLDAVGIINSKVNLANSTTLQPHPNPATSGSIITVPGAKQISIYTLQGMLAAQYINTTTFHTADIPAGIYLIESSNATQNSYSKLIIQ